MITSQGKCLTFSKVNKKYLLIGIDHELKRLNMLARRVNCFMKILISYKSNLVIRGERINYKKY